jgi:hypothetical protein
VIGREDLRGINISFPPLAEQHRIVAKVEEFLALCDELEARQTAAREHHTRLVRSALDHLTTEVRPSPVAATSARTRALKNSDTAPPYHAAAPEDERLRTSAATSISSCANSRISPQDPMTSPPSAKPSSPSPFKANSPTKTQRTSQLANSSGASIIGEALRLKIKRFGHPSVRFLQSKQLNFRTSYRLGGNGRDWE